VWRACHDVRRGGFETQANSEKGRGDEIGEENLERREGKGGYTITVLKGESDQEKDYLGDVGDQEVEEEL